MRMTITDDDRKIHGIPSQSAMRYLIANGRYSGANGAQWQMQDEGAMDGGDPVAIALAWTGWRQEIRRITERKMLEAMAGLELLA